MERLHAGEEDVGVNDTEVGLTLGERRRLDRTGSTYDGVSCVSSEITRESRRV